MSLAATSTSKNSSTKQDTNTAEDKKTNHEYVLMGKQAQVTFANNAKILNDPNVFIGDTGATTDTVNSRY
eukprot:3781721-Ditylum_brightwellii.AAC.1